MNRKNLYSLFILLSLLAYLLLIDSKHPSTDEIKENSFRVLPTSIQKIKTIHWKDFTLTQTEENFFRILKPFPLPGNPDQCRALFSTLENLQKEGTPENLSSQRIKDFQKDKVPLVIKGVSGHSFTLFLEPSEKYQNQFKEIFASTEKKEQVFTVKGELLAQLPHSPLSHTTNQPFDFIEKEDFDLILHQPKGPLHIKKKSLQYWVKNSSGILWPGKEDTLSKLSKQLNMLSILEYHTEPLSDEQIGLSENQFRIEVFGKDGKHRQIFLGNKSPSKGKVLGKLEVGGRPLIFPEVLNQLKDLPFDTLLSPSFFEGSLSQLSDIKILNYEQKKTHHFYGKGHLWTMSHPMNWAFHPGKVLNYLLKTFILDVTDRIVMTPEGRPEYTVEVSFLKQLGGGERFHFYKASEKEFWVHPEKLSTLGKMSKDFSSKLLEPSPFEWVSPSFFILLLERFDSFKNISSQKQLSHLNAHKNALGQWVGAPLTSKLIHVFNQCKVINTMPYKEGIDFGFEKPLFHLQFKKETNSSEKSPLLSLKLGAFSNEKECFFLVNKDFYIFTKGFPLEDFLPKELNTTKE